MCFRVRFLILWFLFALSFSSCSNNDFSVEVRGPLAISPLPPSEIYLSSELTTNPKLTPWLLWNDGTDRSRTGLDSYEVSVGSTSCADDLLPWTNSRTLMGQKPGWSYSHPVSTSSPYLTGGTFAVELPDTKSFVDGNNYYLNIRSKDLLNQVGDPTCERFRYVASGWKQEAYIKSVNNDVSDIFGYQIAHDGDTMVVSALFESSSQTTITNGESASSDNSVSKSGAAYVYRKVGGLWKQEAYIKPPNPRANNQFGKRLAISGDTIAISAPYESTSQTTITPDASGANTLASGSGAVYVYVRSGTSWTLQAYVKASNAQSNDMFGDALALNGNTLAVSSIGEDSDGNTIINGSTSLTNNSRQNTGAVYVYTRSGTSWTQQAYIKPSNPTADDFYGNSLSLDVDTLVVGSTRESSNSTSIINGTTPGSSDDSATAAGAVYVYKRTGNDWAQEAYIKSPTATAGDNFGEAVSVSGDTIAVGVPSESTGAGKSGAVYMFKRTAGTWAIEATIKAPNIGIGYAFGSAISVYGDKVAIGSPLEGSNHNTITLGSFNGGSFMWEPYTVESGAVYIYSRTGSEWLTESFIKARNSYAVLHFGNSVHLNSTMLSVGAVYDTSSGSTIINGPDAKLDIEGNNGSGAAYVFTP